MKAKENSAANVAAFIRNANIQYATLMSDGIIPIGVNQPTKTVPVGTTAKPTAPAVGASANTAKIIDVLDDFSNELYDINTGLILP